MNCFRLISLFITPFLLTSCTTDKGGNINEDKSDTTVSITDFEKTEDGFLGKINNDVETFSFINRVNVPKEATWSIYSDVAGTTEIPTKTIECSIGDNYVYLLVNKNGESIGFYKVNVHRFDLYNVTFNTNGGSYVPPQTVQEESLLSPVDNPTRTGYEFVSWDYDFKTPVMRNLVINANWSANSYIITFDPNGGTCDSSSMNVTYGTYVTLPTPLLTGYSFVGWYSGDVLYKTGVWNHVGNVSLKAKWEKRQFTITYVLDGGELEGSTTQIVGYGDEFILKTPTRTGYEFKGWFNGDVKFESGEWFYLEDKTLVAHWLANQYTINFYLDGGTMTSSTTMTVTYDSPYYLPTPSKKGYTFLGWFNGDIKIENSTWTRLEDLDLTAKWSANTYSISLSEPSSLQNITIKFDFNMYPNTIETRYYTLNSAVSIPYPTRTGYVSVFGGWSTEKDNENTRIDVTKVSQSMTVYALWVYVTKPNDREWPSFEQMNYGNDSLITRERGTTHNKGFAYAIVAPVSSEITVTLKSGNVVFIYAWNGGTNQTGTNVLSEGESYSSTVNCAAGDVLYFWINGSYNEVIFALYYTISSYESFVYNPEPLVINTTFNESFNLGIPYIPAGKTFAGWYYKNSSNEDVLLTNSAGNSLQKYDVDANITAYPYFQ